METPGNTNPNVLKSLLENIASFGSQYDNEAVICKMVLNEETGTISS
jgi:hypothetical protein